MKKTILLGLIAISFLNASKIRENRVKCTSKNSLGVYKVDSFKEMTRLYKRLGKKFTDKCFKIVNINSKTEYQQYMVHKPTSNKRNKVDYQIVDFGGK